MPDQRPTSPYSPESGDAALEQAGASRLQPKDPARIGPYVSLGLLGKGGMGRVYLARPADDSPGLAAVKVIRPEYAEDADFRRRFEREAAVHGQVRTPHAPQLLGTGFQDELLWMATQYVPGLNLAEATRECGGLEPAGVWRLIGELGQALSSLAAAGIVHRDLKPSNVILSTWGAHVIDFGISQAADSSAITTTGSRVGTPAFMSPEYLREGRCDTASDVFSLASTLVYAATARAPFGDGTGVDVMHRVAFEEPRSEIMDDLAEADPPLAALLLACLSKDPAGRPTPQQLIDAAPTHPRTSCGPHEPHESHEPTWQEPLGSLLLARRAAHEVLGHTSAEQMGHFHAPAQRAASPGPAPAPVPAFGPPPATPVSPYSASTPVPAPPPGFGPAMATADSTPTAAISIRRQPIGRQPGPRRSARPRTGRRAKHTRHARQEAVLRRHCGARRVRRRRERLPAYPPGHHRHRLPRADHRTHRLRGAGELAVARLLRPGVPFPVPRGKGEDGRQGRRKQGRRLRSGRRGRRRSGRAHPGGDHRGRRQRRKWRWIRR